MPSLIQFDERTTEEIVQVVRLNLSRIIPVELRKQPQPVFPKPLHYHALITETVTPAEEDVPGFGKGIIHRYDTGEQKMMKLWEEPQLIRTVAPAAVHPSVWVPIHIDAWGDFWTETDSGIKVFITPASGIPARTGAELPNAMCELQRLSVDPLTGIAKFKASLDSLGNQITQRVYNMGFREVNGSDEIQAVLIDSRMVANWEEC